MISDLREATTPPPTTTTTTEKPTLCDISEVPPDLKLEIVGDSYNDSLIHQGSIIQYTCTNPELVPLDGDTNHTCMADGTILGKTPICVDGMYPYIPSERCM